MESEALIIKIMPLTKADNAAIVKQRDFSENPQLKIGQADNFEIRPKR